MDTRAIQERLKALGFNPGAIDGAFGRGTIAAIKALQAARHVPVDGVIGLKTLALLFPETTTLVSVPKPSIDLSSVPPWLAEGRRKKGLTEGRDKKALTAWLKSDGKGLGDPSKLPWCGDFVETCIALTLPDERLPANPYYAQNWSVFGVAAKAALGAILVFKRPGGGHVGLYEGESGSYYSVLGGNQSNAISVSRVAKARCVAIRWPQSYPLPNGGAVKSAAGTITTNEA